MAGEWRIAKLSECASFQEGYVNPTQTNPDFFGDEIKWLRANDLNDGYVFDTTRRLSTAGFESAGKSALLFEPDTLAISKSGTIGRIGILKDWMCGNRAVINIKVDKVRCNPRFIFYVLLQNRPTVENLAIGSVQKNLYTSALGKLEFQLPPKTIQDEVANILGSLDDKIELNRRMNDTLEAIARAMFKSWFVDFDPVRARMSGEPPASICQRLGLTPDLLALFPDRLVDSDLGEIPEGWEVKPLDQLTSYLNRGVSPKYVEEGGVLVLNQKCVRDSHVDSSKARRHDPTQRKVDGRLLEIGDVLVNSTGVGTLGRVAQLLVLGESAIVDSHVTVVRADAQKVSWNYLGVALLERQTEIEALGEGSTGQTELSRTRLGTLPVLLPPIALRTHFDECVLDLRRKTSMNNVQNVGLAETRDVLLPKLISGELRVPATGEA